MKKGNNGVIVVKILELVADGEWHIVDHIMPFFTEIIPSDRAAKRGNKNKQRRRDSAHWRPCTKATVFSRIDAGRRQLVTEAILRLIHAGVVEAEGKDKTRRVRLKATQANLA
jgi:hypothetical protein